MSVIGDDPVEVSDRIRYLGVIFHDRFYFVRHTDFVLSRAKKIFFAYCGLSPDVRLLIYRQPDGKLRLWEWLFLSACLEVRHEYSPMALSEDFLIELFMKGPTLIDLMYFWSRVPSPFLKAASS